LYLGSVNRFTLISVALLGLSISSANAAILNVNDSGKLLGASGVNFFGFGLYDVVFADGSCGSVFGALLGK
jgi:hypothetical protein